MGSISSTIVFPFHFDNLTPEQSHVASLVPTLLTGRVRNECNALPTYTMQTGKLPTSTCEEIEAHSRPFIWGSTNEKKKPHLVKWEQVCQPKLHADLPSSQFRLHP